MTPNNWEVIYSHNLANHTLETGLTYNQARSLAKTYNANDDYFVYRAVKAG